MTSTGDAAGRRLAIATTSLLVLLLFALRGVLAYVREPFFDELFTVWISRKPFAGIVAALRLDSGPPLYYFLTHLAGASVSAARIVSLVCALLALVAVMSSKWLGEVRWAAAILLGAVPAHFYFSAEARAYALCALLAGVGMLLIARWTQEGAARHLWIGSAAILGAAYAHYYGVLFFPLPFAAALMSSRRRELSFRGFAASAACGVAYIPGFLLASIQPVGAATRWMSENRAEVALSLPRLSFAGPYPPSFVAPPPLWMQITICGLVSVVLLFGLARAPLARLFALATLLPIALAAIAAFAGRGFYFPFRFESVLAVPFALWLAASMQPIPRGARSLILVVFLAAGFSECLAITVQQARSAETPYRAAATVLRERFDAREPIVASGYAYLEVVSRIDARWQPRIASFPADQATHPGWRSEPTREQLSRELEAMPAAFLWIGERGSLEERVLRSAYRSAPLLRADPVVVVRMVK